MEVLEADLGKFASTAYSNDVVGEAESLQFRLIYEHLGEELGTFCVDFI